jgi:hypothetical protein
MSALKSRIGDIVAIGLCALLSATAVPLYLISVQPQEFAHFDIGAFLKLSLVVAAILFMAGGVLYALLVGLGRANPARFLVYFALSWVALTGFILPVVGSTSLVDPAKLDENYLNIVLALVGAAFLAALALSSRLRLIPMAFVGILFLVTFLPSVPTIYRLYSAPEQKAAARKNILALSQAANLLVLSLDGIPNNVVSKILESDPELRMAFRDFLVFENAVALAPSTTESMMAELFGNRNFHEIGAKQEEVLARLDHKLVPFNQPTTDNAFQVTFGFYSRFNDNEATRLDTGDISGRTHADILVDMVMFFEYSLARLASARAVRLLRKLEVTQHAMSPLVSSYHGELALRLFEHKGPLWDLEHIKQLRDYEAYIAGLRLGGDRRYIAYLHFSHTHFPVDLDADCAYRGDDAAWIAQRQNRSGITEQALCGLRQTARLLERLRALGVYDNTLLVIKSDHGETAGYFDEPPHSLRINAHPLWGFNRYRPFLMVKDRGQRLAGPEVVTDLVTLGDLAQTMCLRWDRRPLEQCKQFPGVDLLGPRDLRESPDFYLSIVKDALSDFTFDTHRTIRLNRGDASHDLLEKLQGAKRLQLIDSLE